MHSTKLYKPSLYCIKIVRTLYQLQSLKTCFNFCLLLINTCKQQPMKIKCLISLLFSFFLPSHSPPPSLPLHIPPPLPPPYSPQLLSSIYFHFFLSNSCLPVYPKRNYRYIVFQLTFKNRKICVLCKINVYSFDIFVIWLIRELFVENVHILLKRVENMPR